MKNHDIPYNLFLIRRHFVLKLKFYHLKNFIFVFDLNKY